MIQLDSQAFVVFDLDDTLYKENRYHDSGLEAVSLLVRELYHVEVLNMLQKWKSEQAKDLWGKLCDELKLPLSVKESLVWQYRLHSPNIFLEERAKKVIHRIKSHTQGIAILTDGRSVTQRLKLSALGLSEYPAYISEEWGSVKPSPDRFTAIMTSYPSRQYVYVGDNPQKDFKAPNELGWITIGLKGEGSNIHSQDINQLSGAYVPDFWINKLEQICEFLC